MLVSVERSFNLGYIDQNAFHLQDILKEALAINLTFAKAAQFAGNNRTLIGLHSSVAFA